MEPKENLNSDPQKEVKDSIEKEESVDVNENVQASKEDEKQEEIPEYGAKDADSPEQNVDSPEVEEREENSEEGTSVTEAKEIEEETAPDEKVTEQKSEENAKAVEIAGSKSEVQETIPEEQSSTEDEARQVSEENVKEEEALVKEENENTEANIEDSSKVVKDEVDYAAMSEVDLINEFRNLLANGEFSEIQAEVDKIKVSFYKKQKQKKQEQKMAFLDAGGFEEDFKAEEDPYEKDLKDLLGQYRSKKAQYNKLQEVEKEENLKLKHQVIEEIKELVNSKESINKTFQEFKELQQKWHNIGMVPQASLKDLWENYHHHVENFYDYIKINKELRDLDLKKNMEEKIVLCEKAEALLLESSVIKAFNALQKLHDAWREIGPVPRDKKEELWERFKDATTKINKKHQEFFESRKSAQKKNLETKAALCEKVEEILDKELKNHKEWEDKSKEIIEIQKYWRTIGFAPKKDNSSIYERFRKACDAFFDNKRGFYAKHKEIQANNLQLKIDLCVQAEALKESDDWKQTTQEYIDIQKKWKEIGPVPRKHSDSVWKRFRTACDYFFERKSEFFENIDEKQVENLKLKNELVEEVKNFKPAGNDEEDFEKLKSFQRRWSEIGHVPFKKKDEVQKRYREAINEQFDKLKVDDRDRNLLKFRNKVSGLKNTSRGQNKMYAERDKYVTKLKNIESDLITLKNNIGFFSNSKNAEALIKDVKQKIKNNEEQIEYLKDKIRIIDQMDQDGE